MDFIAQVHFQDPDLDSEYGSGFRIWFRIQPGNLNPDPPGSETLLVSVYLWYHRYW